MQAVSIVVGAAGGHITFADGKLCVRTEGGQQLLTMTMDSGDFAEAKSHEPLERSQEPRNACNLSK
jgi:hypothetical protein